MAVFADEATLEDEKSIADTLESVECIKSCAQPTRRAAKRLGKRERQQAKEQLVLGDDRHSTSSQGSDGKAFEAKYNSLCKMALDNEDQCYEAMDLLGELVSVEGHSDRLFDILERIQEQIMRL